MTLRAALAVAGAARSVAGRAQVRGDELARGGRVAALERGGDLAVVGDEALRVGGVTGERDRGDPLLTVAQRIVEAREDGVAGGADDRTVEAAVRAREVASRVAGGDRALLLGDL